VKLIVLLIVVCHKASYIGLSTGDNSMEIKSEADSNDAAECSHDDEPCTGMFGFYDAVFFPFICHCVKRCL